MHVTTFFLAALPFSWTVGGEKQVESIRAARAARAKASLEEAQETAAKLSARPIVVAHKAGADGRLFGSVKADAIADAIEEAGLGTIDSAPFTSVPLSSAPVSTR